MEKESFWKSTKDKVFEKLPDTFVEGLFYKLNFSNGRNLANDSIEFFIVGHVLYCRSVNNYADCSYSPHKYTRCGESVIVNICGFTFLDVRSANYKLVLIGCHPADLNTFQQLSFGSHLSLRSKFSKSSVELHRISRLVLISNIIRKPEDYSTMHRCNAVLELVSESKARFAPESFAQAVQLLKKLNCVEFIVYQVESERPIYANIKLLAWNPPGIKTALELMNSLPNGRCGEWNIAMVLNPPSNYPAEEYQLESQKMMAACKDGSLAALRASLDHLNKIILTQHARDQGNWSPLEHVVQSALDCKNDEPLFVRYLDCIKILLDHGASPTARTKSGYSAFVDVLLGIRVSGIDRISKLAQPFWSKLKDEEKKRAFFTILSSPTSSRDVIDLFFTNGIDGNLTDAKGRTALHIAVQLLRPKELVAYLLDEKNADATVVDVEGKTALHLAIQPPMDDERKEVIRRLVKRAPATVDVSDKTGETPRKRAGQFNCISIIESALAIGASLNTSVQVGSNPAATINFDVLRALVIDNREERASRGIFNLRCISHSFSFLI